MEQNMKQPQKEFLTTALLSVFVGWLGVDRFYIGKIGTGILKLITFGGFGVWYLIDLILIFTGSMRTKDGEILVGREKNLKTALIVAGGLFILGMGVSIGAGSNSNPAQSNTRPATTESDSKKQEATEVESNAEKKTAGVNKVQESAKSELTTSQKNAVDKAKSYLSFAAFSRDGLVAQLEFDKFSNIDAVYGADNAGADWNEQAAKKAKSYMDFSSFSRQGLIDQLVFDKFTTAQATHGVDSVGL